MSNSLTLRWEIQVLLLDSNMEHGMSDMNDMSDMSDMNDMDDMNGEGEVMSNMEEECAMEGKRSKECGADPEGMHPNKCCEGFVCAESGFKCVPGLSESTLEMNERMSNGGGARLRRGR